MYHNVLKSPKKFNIKLNISLGFSKKNKVSFQLFLFPFYRRYTVGRPRFFVACVPISIQFLKLSQQLHVLNVTIENYYHVHLPLHRGAKTRRLACGVEDNSGFRRKFAGDLLFIRELAKRTRRFADIPVSEPRRVEWRSHDITANARALDTPRLSTRRPGLGAASWLRDSGSSRSFPQRSDGRQARKRRLRNPRREKVCAPSPLSYHRHRHQRAIAISLFFSFFTTTSHLHQRSSSSLRPRIVYKQILPPF